ncbi:MAG TPA: hypothetical protein VEL31_29840 [Ktedonobacteraceae bacterium]|nr:hypothetical protein [Ktedonobacteraceae bacterium]
MDTTTVVLIICLCLASFVLGMIAMAIILHPYRKELKRAHRRETARRQLHSQLRDLDR